MVTVIHEGRETGVATARVGGDGLWLSSEDAHRATGWTLRPEGLCHEGACVPAPRGREADFVQGDTVNIAAFWRHIGHPVVRDDAGEVWVLGDRRRRAEPRPPVAGGPGLHAARPRRTAPQPLGSPREEGAAGDLGLLVRLP